MELQSAVTLADTVGYADEASACDAQSLQASTGQSRRRIAKGYVMYDKPSGHVLILSSVGTEPTRDRIEKAACTFVSFGDAALLSMAGSACLIVELAPHLHRARPASSWVEMVAVAPAYGEHTSL